MKINRRQCITYAFVIAAYIVLQILSGQKVLSSTARGMLVPICAYVVMAVSLNLTVGVMGELSLGHAGFMSVGAFMGTTAAVSLQGVIASAPLRLAIAMVIGAIFAAIIGFLIGIPVLRLRGDYLAIVTLAFGEIIKSIFTNLYIGLDSRGYHIRFLQAPENLEEGGKLILGGPMGIGGVQKIATFTGGFILVMLCLVVIFHLVNSRTGRAILAIRDNRIAAESVGIPVTRYKMTAFVISASMAGAAGALFALNYSTIAANKFDFNASILILVFVVFGGLGNMLGSVIAAALLTALPRGTAQLCRLPHADLRHRAHPRDARDEQRRFQGAAAPRDPRPEGGEGRCLKSLKRGKWSNSRAQPSSPSAIWTKHPCWNAAISASISAVFAPWTTSISPSAAPRSPG